jgi:cytochrome c553
MQISGGVWMRKALKWAGLGLGGIVAIILVLGTSAFAVGRSRINGVSDVQPRVTQAATDAGAVERGRHVAQLHGCLDCHTATLAGQKFLDIPPALVYSTNLTPGKGGVGAKFTAGDFDRAIRFGVRPDGMPLLPFMPSPEFNNLSDADMADLIAYLQALPPVDNEQPKSKLKPIGYLMMASPDFSPKKVRSSMTAPFAVAPTPAPTAEYGEYLAASTCKGCHGKDLRGAKGHDAEIPFTPSLMQAASWPLEVFTAALREGNAPRGKLRDAMPWKSFSNMTDVEVAAVHEYLKKLAAQPQTEAD